MKMNAVISERIRSNRTVALLVLMERRELRQLPWLLFEVLNKYEEENQQIKTNKR